MAYLKNKSTTRCSEFCMYKPTTAVWQSSAASLFKITFLASALAALGLTTGCSSSQSVKPTNKSSGLLDAGSFDSMEDLLSATDMRAVEGDRLQILKHGDVWKRMTIGFKMDENHWDSRIEAQRSWFVSRQPFLDRLSARASRYLYHTVKEAERRGLPTELALLPIIESSYDPAATSSAAAAGLWQFIPSTGRIYGLRQTGSYDGRRDVVESTRAAYEFLGSLYNQFGSWELALAAYNAGPGRIQQAINRNQAAGLPTDYWSLRLPQETMNYVPRFLAVAQIVKSPSKYGVSLPPIANRPHFREIQVQGGASLNQIASITGLSRAELYQLNPGYRGESIDPSSPMRIIIPADLSPSVDAKLRALKGSADSGYWASNTAPTPVSSYNSPSSSYASGGTTSSVTTRTAPSVVSSPSTSNSGATSITQTLHTPTATTTKTKPVISSTSPSTITTSNKRQTPNGADELAAFAASADVPSAPRIPVAVTPTTNVKPVNVEPPISAKERKDIIADVQAEGSKATVAQVLQPQATKAETEQVVQEIKAIAPKGTEILDPYDGKIKLTAIQTSQSVADQQGKENTVGFAYPKALAETTTPDSEEAKRNKDKTFIKTDTEIVVAPPKGKRSTYTVLPGDTLAIIAAKNGVNWRDIAKWNQIDPAGTLFVGSSLYLYDAKQPQVDTPKVTKDNTPAIYIVKPNESLTSVANDHDLSVQQLASYNNLTVTSNLFVGQKLALRDNSTSSKATVANTVKADNKTAKIKTKIYVVKRGEYLKLIADRYALSNQELADLTPGLSAGSNLMVGQKIHVPLNTVNTADENTTADTRLTSKAAEKIKAENTVKTEAYKVQRGDTLSSIAGDHKISLSDLADLNNFAANKSLMAGQTIKVPAISKTPDSYTVQSGDSLSAIASKYNLPVAKLADLNGLSSNAGVFVGQKLQLTGDAPASNPKTKSNAKQAVDEPNVHVVKSGETLATIAKKYHLQLAFLADLNGLSKNSAVRAGQRLKIDGDLPEKSNKNDDKAVAKSAAKPSKNTEKYTVQAGESLHSIAGRVGISVSDLADLNNISAKTSLRRGQSILVPKTISEYKVKSGDSLIRLAAKYGIETDQLAEMNDLKPNSPLRIGAVIKVPN